MRNERMILMSPGAKQRKVRSTNLPTPWPPHPQPLSPRRAGGEGSRRSERLSPRRAGGKGSQRRERLSIRRVDGYESQRRERLEARRQRLEAGRVSDFYPLASNISSFRLPSPPELVRGREAGGEGVSGSRQFATGNAQLPARSQQPWCLKDMLV